MRPVSHFPNGLKHILYTSDQQKCGILIKTHHIIPSPNTESITREFFGNNADIIFPSLRRYKSSLVIISLSSMSETLGDGKYNDDSRIAV